MERIVPEQYVQEKRKELRKYMREIENAIADLTLQLKRKNETIEALKICADTLGGSEKIKELSSLNFDTKILARIDSIINTTSIYEEIQDKIIQKS